VHDPSQQLIEKVAPAVSDKDYRHHCGRRPAVWAKKSAKVQAFRIRSGP